MNIPNLFSFARLVSVPLAVWLMIDGRMTAAFWLVAAAGVTDALDGFIAKRFDARTELGAYLDPLADKTLLVGAYATLGWLGHIPVWLVILVIFRDLFILGGAVVVQAITQSFKAVPMTISKVNTVAQIALIGLVLARLGLGLDDYGATGLLIPVVAATTILSGFAYLVHWSRRLARIEDAR
ncbi:MAG: CDP-alcohol phosphatidyltransferase family protein [Rhodospirillales bacterium]|nr:CDP-alcohol phosphatidyltransferase family protein [Rhodospirillales bacterium]